MTQYSARADTCSNRRRWKIISLYVTRSHANEHRRKQRAGRRRETKKKKKKEEKKKTKKKRTKTRTAARDDHVNEKCVSELRDRLRGSSASILVPRARTTAKRTIKRNHAGRIEKHGAERTTDRELFSRRKRCQSWTYKYARSVILAQDFAR